MRQIEREKQEKETLANQLSDCQKDLEKVRDSYRSHLQDSVARSDVVQSSAKGTPLVSNGNHPAVPLSSRSNASGADGIEQAWQSMITSFGDNEKSMSRQLDSSQQTIQRLTGALRQLYDHYRCFS